MSADYFESTNAALSAMQNTPRSVFGVVESLVKGLIGVNTQLTSIGVPSDEIAKLNAILVQYAQALGKSCESSAAVVSLGNELSPPAKGSQKPAGESK